MTRPIIKPTPTPQDKKQGIASGRWPNKNEQAAGSQPKR